MAGLMIFHIFVLYICGIPAADIRYFAGLELVFFVLAAVFCGIRYWYRLRTVKRQIRDYMQGMQALSDTEDALEEVYMDALEQLQNKRQEEKGAYRNLQREMEEYYALWVHQIKTPISAMRLLLQQDRTEKELRDRLYRAGFSETASEAAMQYVSGFGYLDDRRYAENYISFHKGRRSRKEISFKLKNKGVPPEILSMAMEGYEIEDESVAIEHLIQKKIKGQRLSDMEYTQLNKITAYLARKGFSFPVISRAMREMKERESS